MILFGLRDKGSVNSALPVIKILRDRGFAVSIFAQGPAQDFLKDKFKIVSEAEFNQLLCSVRPLTLIVGTAHKGSPFSPVELIRKARCFNLSVVLVEDIWASHSAFKWDVMPDGICVMDEFAKGLILNSWPDYPEPKIYVTGSPVFDNDLHIETEIARKKLRSSLKLDKDWPVIFFPGQVWGMVQGVSILVNAINKLNIPVYLILKDHPSICSAESSDEFRRIYHSYRQVLKSLRAGMVIDPYFLDGDSLNAGSDIVVGMYSTMTVEACYMHKPVLIISTPEIRKTLMEATNGALAEWPITKIGAALKAESVNEIKTCLKKIIIGDTAEMLQVQQEHFKADGLSAERIARVILSYYQQKRL